MVPLLVVCHKCGATLYESIELKHLDEVVQSHDGKCPTCGRRLPFVPKNVEVKPADETNQPSLHEPEKKKPSRKKSRNKTKKRERRWYAQASYEPRSGGIWKKN